MGGLEPWTHLPEHGVLPVGPAGPGGRPRSCDDRPWRLLHQRQERDSSEAGKVGVGSRLPPTMKGRRVFIWSLMMFSKFQSNILFLRLMLRFSLR
jgi:hypothetical protein